MVLSLFDGISCGRIAFDRAGITIDSYYASEIEKDSIKVSKENYPDIIQLGDIRKLDFKILPHIDMIIGGSPCSYWSNARTSQQSTRERYPNGTGYELFGFFVEAVKELKPKYFLYENNYSMSEEVRNQISSDLHCKPIMIDSALVCAQSRKRLYWCNFDVSVPIDRNICISDVIPDSITGAAKRNQLTKNGYEYRIDIRKDLKSNCLVTFATKRNCCVQTKEGSIRPLTADEYEILQTLPKGYTKCLSESSRKTVIALGWTIDVITHILNHIPESDNYIKPITKRRLLVYECFKFV